MVTSGIEETAEHLLLLLLYVCTYMPTHIAPELNTLVSYMYMHFSSLSCLATHEQQVVGLHHQAVSYNRDTPSEGSQTISGPIPADVEDGCSVTETRRVARESCGVQRAAITRGTNTTQAAAIS